jgi:hypothetical protein
VSIIPQTPERDPQPALTILPALLGDNVARLQGRQLWVDPTADADEQLAAIADAVRFLRTGRCEHGRRVRHLRAVTA